MFVQDMFANTQNVLSIIAEFLLEEAVLSQQTDLYLVSSFHMSCTCAAVVTGIKLVW